MSDDGLDGRRMLALRQKVVAKFDTGSWIELGLLTNSTDIIDGHDRLLRSLRFSDPDYDGNALDVLMRIVRQDPLNLEVIEDYVAGDATGTSVSVSSVQNDGPRIYVQPDSFKFPKDSPNRTLLSAMMPFSSSFDGVYAAIGNAASMCGMHVKRADNVWGHSTIIQDIFDLIYTSHIVVCDFTGQNPNVFYETGIAHTLGKHVVPIVQNISDLPFDLRHHRCITYLNNSEGRAELEKKLSERISYLLHA